MLKLSTGSLAKTLNLWNCVPRLCAWLLAALKLELELVLLTLFLTILGLGLFAALEVEGEVLLFRLLVPTVVHPSSVPSSVG